MYVHPSTAVAHPPTRNHLLAALPALEYQQLLPHLEPVELTVGCSIYEPGERMGYVFFPTTGLVSLLYSMEDDASAEIAVTGNEGMVGVSMFMGGMFMGGDITSSRVAVVSAGQAYRLRTPVLKREFERSGNLQQLLLRYTQALLRQMAQTAVCNQYHTVEQQVCRWLLLSLDRSSSNGFHMTQQLISNMLGLRREGVSEAAGRLQRAGLIQTRRGSITVLDRPGLEQRVCECYAVVKREADRLLSWKPGPDSGQACKDVLMRCTASYPCPFGMRV